MTRRTIGVIILGLLMALFCLAIGGLACLQPGEEITTTAPNARCKLVVGSQMSEVAVFYCVDFATATCFYTARNGGFLEVPCAPHPFVEENPYEN